MASPHGGSFVYDTHKVASENHPGGNVARLGLVRIALDIKGRELPLAKQRGRLSATGRLVLIYTENSSASSFHGRRNASLPRVAEEDYIARPSMSLA
jgi:hypothetical protein